MTALTLTVITFNGQPGDATLAAQFDETGGLIGRADTNQLVLPDPERSISRVHAQVVYRSPNYALIDRGSNPITVNGRAAGANREIALADGDVVRIGGYELRVSVGAAAAAAGAGPPADPFADLLGAAPAARPAGGGAPAWPDPLKRPAARPPAAASSADPFAGFGAAAPAAGRGGPAASAIPDDWDPFAASAPAGPARAGAAAPLRGGNALGLDTGAAAPQALIPDLGGGAAVGGSGDSLDALFGLKAGAGADPFADSALDAPAAQPNMAGHADPVKALNAAPRASSATQSDALSDLQRPFVAAPSSGGSRAPAAESPAAPPAAEARPPASAAAALDRPRAAAGARLSWDDEPGDGMTVIRAPVPHGAAAAPPLPAPAPVPADPPATGAAVALKPAPDAPPTPPPKPDPVAPAPPRRAAAAGAVPAASPAAVNGQALPADVQALTDSFREGLDAPDVRFDGLTPELMHLIGQLLHEAAAGTVAMLQARAALKRELQAEVTMIAARQNNPLKFSPSAEVALQHLLAPSARGFMAAAPAMQDAYADLCAHQFGMVAGLRAALEGVLGRFDPAELEGRLAQRSLLHSLLPASRKAKLWELFVEHYGQIREEAADDFQTLFGRAFLQAYEEHIAQMEGGQP